MGGAPRAGVFITIEGGDGSGKSTLLRALQERLVREGFPVTVTAEPGGTELGHYIKRFFEEAAGAQPTPVAEVFLFEAARAQNVSQVIRPALERGEIVLCDRFADSTVAYQGHGRGLPLDAIERCNEIATDGLQADLTLLLDLPEEAGLSRAHAAASDSASGRKADSLGSESPEFHALVREGFLALAKREPGRIKVLDAGQTPQQVAEAAWRHVKGLLRNGG